MTAEEFVVCSEQRAAKFEVKGNISNYELLIDIG